MIPLALFGCGGMGCRHIRGLRKLQEIGQQRFELVAVCDLVPENAERAAALAEELLGRRPQVFPSFSAMSDAMPNVAAIIVTTSPDSHAAVGIEALDAGVHVMVEKPVTLTVRQGLELVAAARRANRKLAVAENYRRDPINRLAKALLDAGAVGKPFLAIQSSSGSGEKVIITPWRHQKRACGIVVDMGIHYADLLEYYLGPIASVVGMTATVDERRMDDHGNWHPVDAEDLLAGVARFESGALANLVINMAGRGDPHFTRVIYGTGGTLSIPHDRTGQPLTLTIREAGQDRPVAEPDQRQMVPDFALDPVTAALFGGDRLSSYQMDWADVDANLLAIEQADFADAITQDREPEVSGMDGLRSLALSYGFFEAERLGRIVAMPEILTSDPLPYQAELDRPVEARVP